MVKSEHVKFNCFKFISIQKIQGTGLNTKHVQEIWSSLEMTLLEFPSIATNGADIEFAKKGVLDEVSVCVYGDITNRNLSLECQRDFVRILIGSCQRNGAFGRAVRCTPMLTPLFKSFG